MIMKRTRFLSGIYPKIDRDSPPNPSPLRRLYRKLLPQKDVQPRYECQYCAETKRATDFVNRGSLPYNCQYHLGNDGNRVCKKCLEAALSAQMDGRTLLQLGCPQCNVPWDPDEVRYLISGKDERKFRMLVEMARESVLVPEEVPEGATMEVLLEKGARFCPWCRWPFIKEGGCDAMQCIKCWKCFNVDYALILEDKDGNRAAPVMDDEFDVV